MLPLINVPAAGYSQPTITTSLDLLCATATTSGKPGKNQKKVFSSRREAATSCKISGCLNLVELTSRERFMQVLIQRAYGLVRMVARPGRSTAALLIIQRESAGSRELEGYACTRLFPILRTLPGCG